MDNGEFSKNSIKKLNTWIVKVVGQNASKKLSIWTVFRSWWKLGGIAEMIQIILPFILASSPCVVLEALQLFSSKPCLDLA